MDPPSPEQPFEPAPAPPSTTELRTFLIADIRGYTTYTTERGDEAGAELAGRFATVVREVVAVHEGFLLELRGDEALCVFVSARHALRAAVDLQERVRAQALPRGIGIGLDAGEVIPLEGGYRGSALNLAARLCSLAGPGETIASETVIHLAAHLEGISYVDPETVRVKGFEKPVRAVRVISGSEVPRRLQGSMRRFRRRVTSYPRAHPVIAAAFVTTLGVVIFVAAVSLRPPSPSGAIGLTPRPSPLGSPSAAASSSALAASLIRGNLLLVHQKGALEPEHIEVMDVATGTTTRLAPPGYAVSPAWSPDRSQIAFTAATLALRPGGYDVGQFSIGVMNADATNSRVVFVAPDSSVWAENPRWSPDGTRLVFDTAGLGLLALDLGTTQQTVLADGGFGGDWALDGSGLVYVRAQKTAGPEFFELVVARPGASDPKVILSGFGVGSPHWSPDGTRIAFEQQPSEAEHPEIFVTNLTGTSVIRLTNDPASDDFPVWSPDGKAIAFTSNRTGVPDMFVMDSSTGDVIAQLTHNPPDAWSAASDWARPPP